MQKPDIEQRLERLEELMNQLAGQPPFDQQRHGLSADDLAASGIHLRKGQHESSLELVGSPIGFPPSLKLQTPKTLNLNIEAGQQLLLQAKHLQIQAESAFFECNTVALEGELSAKLKYSAPFYWRAGQGEVRLMHSSRGFPLIIELTTAKHQTGALNTTRTYIKSDDQYWYLNGAGGVSTIGVIFVGLV